MQIQTDTPSAPAKSHSFANENVLPKKVFEKGFSKFMGCENKMA